MTDTEKEQDADPAVDPGIAPPEGAPLSVGRITLRPDVVEVRDGGDRPASRIARPQLANTWAAWDGLGRLLALLDPAATGPEIDVLGQVPVERGARNGYNEMCQHLASSRKL
jgi:hypothetical protein